MNRTSLLARCAVVVVVAVAGVTLISRGTTAKANVTADAGYARPPVLRVVLSPVPVIPLAEAGDKQPHLGAPAQPPALDDVQTLDVRVGGAEPSLRPGILREINAVRATHGLQSLRSSPLLARAAMAHARALAVAGDFQHEWPDGRPFRTWILRYYPLGAHGYWSSGENLLWTAGGLTARSAISMWLASPEHRRNMLDPRWSEIGVGVVHAAGAGGAFAGYDVDLAATEFGTRR
jgi:uncharacterized protein YkwD